MSQVSPFHSVNPADGSDKKVYHDNSTCQAGRAIDPNYKRSGTDGRPLCEICDKHNKEGR